MADRELHTERARSADSEKAAKQLVQAKEKQLEEHELGLTEKQKELEVTHCTVIKTHNTRNPQTSYVLVVTY